MGRAAAPKPDTAVYLINPVGANGAATQPTQGKPAHHNSAAKLPHQGKKAVVSRLHVGNKLLVLNRLRVGNKPLMVRRLSVASRLVLRWAAQQPQNQTPRFT